MGFGISDDERAAEIARIADAVVVGSAIVKRVAAHIDDAEAMRNDIADLLREMRSAMDAV